MALGTNLPTWPAVVFTYLEPMSTLLGCYTAYSDPASFASRQLPTSTASIAPSQHAILLSYTLGSLFFLLFLLNILCTAITRDVRKTRLYLAALSVGEVAHLYANYKGMGSEDFWDWGNYNDVMLGNVVVTVFLLVNRVVCIGGGFGGMGSEVRGTGGRRF